MSAGGVVSAVATCCCVVGVSLSVPTLTREYVSGISGIVFVCVISVAVHWTVVLQIFHG